MIYFKKDLKKIFLNCCFVFLFEAWVDFGTIKIYKMELPDLKSLSLVSNGGGYLHAILIV